MVTKRSGAAAKKKKRVSATRTGIGYMDAHLLASVLLTSGSRLWTRDRALRKVAQQLSVDAGLK